jgi:hypothetical protein
LPERSSPTSTGTTDCGCAPCNESLEYLDDFWDPARWLLAEAVIKRDKHFHYFPGAGLRNTDGEDTPSMGTPTV